MRGGSDAAWEVQTAWQWGIRVFGSSHASHKNEGLEEKYLVEMRQVLVQMRQSALKSAPSDRYFRDRNIVVLKSGLAIRAIIC